MARRLMVVLVLAVAVAGCGTAATTTSTGTQAATTTTTSATRQPSASLRRLIDKGAPTGQQFAYVDRACTVTPRGRPVHQWLAAEWGGRSILSVAATLSRGVPGRATSSQRSVLVNACVTRILASGS